MARSIKKGPFADASLLKKIDAMNAAMDSAGIQDILDEMNRQAAEYVAEKEVK